MGGSVWLIGRKWAAEEWVVDWAGNVSQQHAAAGHKGAWARAACGTTHTPGSTVTAASGSPEPLLQPAGEPCGLEALETLTAFSSLRLCCCHCHRASSSLQGWPRPTVRLSQIQGSPGGWAHGAALAWPCLHGLSQSPSGLRNRGATGPRAPGSAVSEVTGGTPVLCK